MARTPPVPPLRPVLLTLPLLLDAMVLYWRLENVNGEGRGLVRVLELRSVIRGDERFGWVVVCG